MNVKFLAAAFYGITFQMKLNAKPQFALLRNVLKVGVDRTATVKFVNSEVVMLILYSSFSLYNFFIF